METNAEPTVSAPTRRPWHAAGDIALLVALLALAAAAGYLVRGDDGGATGAPTSADPGTAADASGASTPNDADAGFARDMQVHHAQAVEMSFLIRDRTEDPTIDAVAYDIITSQQQQMGQMYAWLETWGLPQTGSGAVMGWMTAPSGTSSRLPSPSTSGVPGHDMSEMSSTDDEMDSGMSMSTAGGGLMPGMATKAQVDKLRAADGPVAERLFLRLMIRHHRGGIAMAEAGRQLASTEAVRSLSSAIVAAQSAEVEQMQQLLTDRTRDQ